MNMIYSNKEITVSVGKLKGIMNNVKYDFSFLYYQSKKLFPSNGAFYPFSALVNEFSYDTDEIQLSLLSFADENFKEFQIQEPLSVLVCIHSKGITKENMQQTIAKVIHSLDVSRIMQGVKKFSEAIEKECRQKYYIAQFCNIDHATEAASIIAQSEDSYLLKENGKYVLIWNFPNSKNDFTLAQVYDFADSPVDSITLIQLYSKLEYANNIIIEKNAVQHLSCIH